MSPSPGTGQRARLGVVDPVEAGALERPAAPIDPERLAATLQPFGRARMLPRSVYVDDAVLAWERTHLFDGGWVCAGRRPPTGAGIVQTAVRIGATSVLLTYEGPDDGTGELRGFANICRHRGHELLACGVTTSRGVVQCPYHAWTYELDGSLRLAPHAGDVDNLVLGELGLVPVAVAEWGGWVFVNVDGSAPPLDAHLGELPTLIGPWQTDRLVVAAMHHYDLAANWKVAVENYHECYHCPLIHPELCQVSPSDSGVNVDDGSGSFVGGAMRLADHATTMSLDGSSPVPPLAGLDQDRLRQVLYLNVFPNLLISLHPDYVMTHRIEPVTATTSRIECQWLFDPDSTANPGFDPAFAVDFWDITNRQDWAAVESVQRGLASPLFVPGIFTANEDAVYHFATMLAAAYAGGPPARARIGDGGPTSRRR